MITGVERERERGEKHSERVCSCDRSSMFSGAEEECTRDGSMWNDMYFLLLLLYRTVCVWTLPVCVCDACAEPHSECICLGVRLCLLYAGAHRRGIMGRETNLLRSERRDKRNPASSGRDGQRGWAEAEDD